MKSQALFSSKDKSKKLKCRLLQFLFGALRLINCIVHCYKYSIIKIYREIYIMYIYIYVFFSVVNYYKYSINFSQKPFGLVFS